MKRCFVAIKINAESTLINFLLQLSKKLNASSINWVKPANLHLTLAFLAEIDDRQMESVIKVLNEISPVFPAFNCELKGFGSFGSKTNPTVLWIGIVHPPVLHEIKLALDKGLKLTGYKPETKAFKPHLTLGRIKTFGNHKELLRLVNEYNDFSFLKFKAGSLTLFESKLSATGPTYSIIQDFPLKA